MRLTLETKSVRIFTNPNGHLAVELEPVGADGWPKDMPADNIYSIADLTKRLHCSRRTIHNLFRRRKNPLPYSKAGGRPRVTEGDLLGWLSSEKVRGEKIHVL